jgi:hypothetical protein
VTEASEEGEGGMISWNGEGAGEGLRELVLERENGRKGGTSVDKLGFGASGYALPERTGAVREVAGCVGGTNIAGGPEITGDDNAEATG